MRTPFGKAAMNKPEVMDDDAIALGLLEPGLYPMMIVTPIAWMNSWGRHLMSPHLTEIDPQEAARIVKEKNRVYENRLALWRFDHQEWKRTGGQNIDYFKLARGGWFLNYLHYRNAVGTGGFQAELAHYSNIARPWKRGAWLLQGPWITISR
jgi:hypothetical protein